jgi:hypothetical protein
MVKIEANFRTALRTSLRPALEIRFEFVEGSQETYVQPSPVTAATILNAISPPLLFSHYRIVVADDYSKSVFVCSQLNRVDFVFEGDRFSHIPDEPADLVELAEVEFNEQVNLDDPTRLQKRRQPRRVGDVVVSLLRLRMRGGKQVYLMKEEVVKLPVDNQSYMHRLLSKGTLGFRLPGGGAGFLNLANLIGYSVYPGVVEAPTDTWIAQPKPAYERLDFIH